MVREPSATCWSMASSLACRFSASRADRGRVMDDVWSGVSFGIGRKNDEPVDHPVLDRIREAELAPQRALRDLAAAQLGTVGAGNHYVDLFCDEEGFVWIGVHFGSRGLGHKTATAFIKLAGGKDGVDVAPTILHQDSDLGQQYLAAMTLAGEYAYAGREWVIERVRRVTGGEVLDSVHNHHNYAWRERHGERDLWVVRKGAT